MSAAGQARVLVMASTFPRFAGDSMPPFVLRLCQAMQKEGWESLVLAPHAQGLAQVEVLDGIPCRRFRYAPAALERLAYGGGMLANIRAESWLWLLLPFYMLSLLMTASCLLVKERISVVHAHWIIPQGLVAILLKKMFFWRKIQVVITAHGGDLHANMGRLVRSLLHWSMRRADVLAVVSEDMRRLAISIGVPADRVVVASMGVDIERFKPPAPGERRSGVLFVGRLVEKKGVAFLLEAFALLVKKRPDLGLTIVGDGPMRGELEAKARALDISREVEFVGAKPQQEIPLFFQRAELFVMPSIVADSGDQEGLGLVAAEAMSCACPVIAHDIAAVRDLVLDGKTGLMVPPKDVCRLAESMATLLGNPQLAQELAAAGRHHILCQYSWSAVAGRYRQLYAAGLV